MREYHRQMMGSRKRRYIARLLVAATLFAQAAFAFAACDFVERGAVQAIAQSAQPCHEPEMNVNLCVGHCLASDQSLDKPAFFIPALPVDPIFVLARTPPVAVHLYLGRETAKPVAGPPPRILFHSFLI